MHLHQVEQQTLPDLVSALQIMHRHGGREYTPSEVQLLHVVSKIIARKEFPTTLQYQGIVRMAVRYL